MASSQLHASDSQRHDCKLMIMLLCKSATFLLFILDLTLTVNSQVITEDMKHNYSTHIRPKNTVDTEFCLL